MHILSIKKKHVTILKDVSGIVKGLLYEHNNITRVYLIKDSPLLLQFLWPLTQSCLTKHHTISSSKPLVVLVFYSFQPYIDFKSHEYLFLVTICPLLCQKLATLVYILCD